MTTDADRTLAEKIELTHKAIERAIQRFRADRAPTVTAERCVCDDDADERMGCEVGTDYIAGEDDTQVIIYFPDEPGANPHLLDVLIAGSVIPLEDVYTTLANLQAVLADPAVQAAYAAWDTHPDVVEARRLRDLDERPARRAA